MEGITEWLPISSTGHMILLNEFVKLDVSPEFWEMFLVVIQLGAILAVVLLYWNKIWPFTTKKEKVKNRELFEELINLINVHQVEFCWVKGHDGHTENERCDYLATTAAKSKNALEDTGYINNI